MKLIMGGGGWIKDVTIDVVASSNSKRLSSGSGSGSRSHIRGRPTWIIALLVCVSVFLMVAYLHPPTGLAACYIFSSSACTALYHQLRPSIFLPARQLTDDEFASQVVVHEILNLQLQPTSPKIAFLFLTPGPLPFEKLWDNFFYGYDGRFSIYVHASKETSHVSPHFIGRDINHKDGKKQMSVLDTEKRLLTYALLDPDNQHFVLLSESCVPLHSFEYIYHYLVFTNVSFIDSFLDPGPHGNGRYSERMMPEVQKKDFRKGSQWFSMKRQHALIAIADNLYYTKFKFYCKSIEENLHYTSGAKRQVSRGPCLWNGMRRPCYLFARKFYPETLDKMMFIFSNYTSI